MLSRAPARVRTIAFQRETADWELWASTQPEFSSETQSAPAAAPRWKTSGPVVAESAPAVELEAGIQSDTPPTAVTRAEEGANEPVERREQPPMPTTVNAVRNQPEVATSFAGVFFLLNVALYLKLYADFTTPSETGLELNIWDFLCLLGLDLIGEEIKEDGLDGVLAALAGRNLFERPGAHFEPPDEWSVPAAWLAPFPEHFERKEVICNGRVQVIHPAGFVLVDRKFEVAPETEDPMARWLRWVCGYIRARLERALGREDAAEFLCRIPCRVASTSTRVDVFYSLESFPTEIRMAGLDRDPGWMPAAGRYVAYHFQ